MLNLFHRATRLITLGVLTLVLLMGVSLSAFSTARIEPTALSIVNPSGSHSSVLQSDAIADVMIEPRFFGELGDPSNPYYEAVRSLVERYGIDVSLPDGTIRPNEPLTRGDFMVYLNQGLNVMVELMNAQ
jgi:S-layer homology domain